MKKRYYFLSILILFLFNISYANALETNFKSLEVVGYNNNGNSLTLGEQFYCDSSNGNCSMYLTTLANSYGGAWGIQSPISLLENHTYSISLEMRSPNSGLTLSSKPNISIGTTIDNARNNYINSSYNTDTITSSVKNNILQYAFKAKSNAYYFIIPFTTFSTTYSVFYIDKLIIEDLGESSISSTEINNILNNQTSILQSDINNMGDSINNSIKDNFNDCRPSVNLINLNNISFSSSNVNYEIRDNELVIINSYGGWAYLQMNNISVDTSKIYTFSTNFSNSENISNGIIIYDSNNNTIDFDTSTSKNGKFTISFIPTTSLIKIKFSANNNPIVYNNNITYSNIQLELGDKFTTYEPYGKEICSNKIDNLNDTQKETNNKLDDLNDNITDSDSSGASGEAGDFFSNFNTDTFGLTSVITAPLELIKSITSKTCTSLQLTLPFVNEELNLPCLSTIYESYFGSFLTIYRTITFGFVSYWVCIKIFNLVKDFKNPEHDEIEVLDL